MGIITKINDVLCQNIAKIDDVLKGNALKIDDINFCTPTPTPTPTITKTPTSTPGGSQTPTPSVTYTQTPTVTKTPTPTPTPSRACSAGCCFVELCYDADACERACQCNLVRSFYLHQPCDQDPCELAYADGIFDDDLCSTPARAGYYSDGVDCYYWDGSTLTYQGPC